MNFLRLFCRPSTDLLKPIFCRELKPLSDVFVVSVLQAWCSQHCDLLANCIADLLTSRCPTASPSKRKRGQGNVWGALKRGTRNIAAECRDFRDVHARMYALTGQGLGSRSGVSPPSAERILGHLDRARQGCRPMFKVDCMQRVLQIAQAACTDTQRSLYNNLFALLEDDEQTTNTNKTGPSTSKGGRGRKATTGSSAYNSVSSTTANSYSSKHRNASNRSSLKELSDTSESSSEVSWKMDS